MTWRQTFMRSLIGAVLALLCYYLLIRLGFNDPRIAGGIAAGVGELGAMYIQRNMRQRP